MSDKNIELIKENTELKKENTELKKENETLKNDINIMSLLLKEIIQKNININKHIEEKYNEKLLKLWSNYI